LEPFAMTTQTERVNMFIAYAPEDIWLLKQLETHLSLLKREGLISTWCDRQVIPGTNWAGVIDQRLEEALVILLLVSADFLASDYCYQVEIKHALERHQSNKALVVPVLARPVDWKSSPFGHLQVLPSGGKPITAWGNRDKAWVEVVTGLRQVVQGLLKRVPDPTYNTWSTTESEPFIAQLGMPARNTQGVTPPDQVQPPSQALRSSEGKNRRPGSDAQRRSSPEGVSEPSQRRTPFGAPFPETWNVPRGHSLFFYGSLCCA